MREMTVKEAEGKVPVTVLKLNGELDASCYLNVIAEAKELFDGGRQDLLLDMSDVRFMASSGLVTLHSIAKLLRGEELPDPDAGWGAMHDIARTVEEGGGKEAHFKIYGPQPRVDKGLEMTGFKDLLEVYSDYDEAIASFG